MSDLRQLAACARQRLIDGQQEFAAAWREKRDGPALLGGRAALVDQVLQDVWQSLEMPLECALAAVGGYGRGQLYPSSDVDLLILIPDEQHATQDSAAAAQLEQLI